MKKISGKTTARLVKDLTTCELLLSKIVQKKMLHTRTRDTDQMDRILLSAVQSQVQY